MSAKPIQFLEAKRKEEAERLWHETLRLLPVGDEEVPLERALGRVLAVDLPAPIDLPPFDRSVVDGYALVASDTFGAGEGRPARLRLLPGRVLAGPPPPVEVVAGCAVEIATGGVLPRGANAVQMVERTDREGDELLVWKAVVPGANLQYAGSDLRVGEVVLARGTRLGSRETGVLAALGLAAVRLFRRPRAAVLSCGDELVAPGAPLAPGLIYDSNARVVADALVESGAEPVPLGIAPDDEARLEAALEAARGCDVVVLSGGTSKGTGDLSYRLIDRLGKPGIVVHGVQVKPGKPVVLASWEGRPVVVLPGFPTSAILTFNLFVRPVVRRLAGLPPEPRRAWVDAVVPQRVHSAPGRYEYVLVNLVRRGDGRLAAWPIPKSSGSISAFSEADGYLEVPEGRDLLLEGEEARVTLLSSELRLADLVFIGSHCQGMDLLFALLRERAGLAAKALNVGSAGGVAAVRRGEADLAGVHLLDPDGAYNRRALADAGPGAALVRGYRRRQGIVFRREDFPREPSLEALVFDRGRRLLNRARGAGTRVLLDHLVAGLARERGLDAEETARAIPGSESEARSHTAVAAAVASGRADWGIAIESVALPYALGFAALRDEEYDLLVPRDRLASPAVAAALAALRTAEFRERLERLGGFRALPDTGEVVS